MAFPSGQETTTTLASFIPAVWGEKINDFFKFNINLASFFTDRSAELTAGGSVLYTPNMTEMSANAVSVGTAVTLNNTAETKITLTVDQWYEVSFGIPDSVAAQFKQSYAVQERYAKDAAYTIATKLEVALATLFSGFSTVVGASTTNLADSEIRAAIAALETTGVPLYTGEVAFFLHPNVFWKQVQNIDKFSLAINSPVNDPTAKKPDAMLYGIPVYVSQNIQYVTSTTGRNNALAHKDALHFATSALGSGGSMAGSMVGSSGIRVQSHYIPEYLTTVTTADILYGVVENRDNAGVLIRTAN